METVVCDIAKSHMKKDFNAAFHNLGLFVTDIRFDESNGLSVVLEISGSEDAFEFAAEGTKTSCLV